MQRYHPNFFMAAMRSFQMLFALMLFASPAIAEAPSPRATLLEVVEMMGNTKACKQALRPLIEQTGKAQMSELDKGLYFEEIGDDQTARKYYERAVMALNPVAPGQDAWCVAYKLVRIPDAQVNQDHPVVKKMLELRRQLNIPVTEGDLEKSATTERISEIWDALPKSAKAESGPLPKKLSLIERAVALAGRAYAQDDQVAKPSQASARCWIRAANLKPFYVEAAKRGLVDFQLDVANDLAKAEFPGFWEEAVKWYRLAAANGTRPLSVIAATGAARTSERLLSADTPHPPPMTWQEILAAYQAGMKAGHEAAHVLYADALQRGIGGLTADEAEAVRLYKAVIDKTDGFYGGLTTMVYLVHAQSQLTALWQAGKLELNEAEQRRYLTISARLSPSKQP